MSTYYITEPKMIPIETIKEVVLKHDDMEFLLNKSGNSVITTLDYTDFTGKRRNWLHLEIDKETETMTCCFRNGASDCSDILEYLVFSLGCRFISEYEAEYWGVKDLSEAGKD